MSKQAVQIKIFESMSGKLLVMQALVSEYLTSLYILKVVPKIWSFWLLLRVVLVDARTSWCLLLILLDIIIEEFFFALTYICTSTVNQHLDIIFIILTDLILGSIFFLCYFRSFVPAADKDQSAHGCIHANFPGIRFTVLSPCSTIRCILVVSHCSVFWLSIQGHYWSHQELPLLPLKLPTPLRAQYDINKMCGFSAYSRANATC